MKKIFFIVVAFASVGVFAQNEVDALRYSAEDLHGTARYQALSGAFGALGGDFSAFSVNPAGSSVFANGAITATLGDSGVKHEGTFFNNNTSSKSNDFDISQLGAVFVFKDGSSANKIAFGVNYQQNQNFEGNVIAFSGTNPNNSIVDYFGNFAAGYRLADLRTQTGESISAAYKDIGTNGGFAMQQAFLGYQGYLIEPDVDSDDNISYHSNASYSSLNQKFREETYGGTSKVTFNLSFLHNNRFHFGVNLNAHNVNYEKYTRLTESGYNTNSGVQYVDFQNRLLTTGNGFSVQLGGIYKATEGLRLGLAYSSPTWYTLKDETTQYLRTDYLDSSNNLQTITLDPNVVNLYEEYNLRTPSYWTASLAYVFGKRGLISVDYQYKNYANAHYSTKNASYFESENQRIENLLTSASSIRAGIEFKATQALSLRGGLRYEQSPYKDNTIGDLNGYSLGLGYDFGSFSVDAAYSAAKRDSQYQMYEAGLTDRAKLNTDLNNFVVTLLFKL